MSQSRVKRLALIMGCLLPFASVPAMAAPTTADARRFVDDVGSKVLGVLNTQGGDSAQKKQQLQAMFSQHVDMPWMGRFVLGQYWRQATPDQRSRYLQAYEHYLLTRYTTNFADYNGSKYVITDVHDDGDGRFTVDMKINSPEQPQDTLAGYKLQADAGGQFKIRDIIIEGVSLITTERSEFASVAQRDGIDGLIRDIQSKTNADQTARRGCAPAPLLAGCTPPPLLAWAAAWRD